MCDLFQPQGFFFPQKTNYNLKLNNDFWSIINSSDKSNPLNYTAGYKSCIVNTIIVLFSNLVLVKGMNVISHGIVNQLCLSCFLLLLDLLAYRKLKESVVI